MSTLDYLNKQFSQNFRRTLKDTEKTSQKYNQ